MDTHIEELAFKILLIGDIGVGKTCLIKRYVDNVYSVHYKSTVGVDFFSKEIKYNDTTNVKLQIWDMAGQERYGNMTRGYYKDAAAAFIVFDITRQTTFDGVRKWKLDLDNKLNVSDDKVSIPIILLANKIDLFDDEYLEEDEKNGKYCGKTHEEMDKFCEEFGFIGWFETSAKENLNIDKAVNHLIPILLENRKNIVEKVDTLNTNIITDLDNNKNYNYGCCYT